MTMRIVKLTAENFKRLRAVEITPDGDVVVVAGRNTQGKSSVLDAIYLALAGGNAARDTPRPVRDGEEHAFVDLDLGRLRVTRRWDADGKTSLRVTAADGARYDSPQKMLDGLVGALSFDPLAFAGLPEKEQLATLLRLVELPFDPAEVDARRQALFSARTDIGRGVKALDGQLAGMPEPPEDLPAEEVSVADVLAEYREAQNAHARYDTVERERTRLEGEVVRLRAELDAAERALADLPTADSPANLPDLAGYEARLATVEDTNARVRAARERRDVEARLAAARAEQEDLTARIAALDAEKAEALRNAVMPIPGLGFDEDGVTYLGLPFSQASAAERLRVSLAMAMALNPEIRVVRITDGSLLDRDNMRLVAEMAGERDFQVWVERVDDDAEIGFVIEDGEVVGMAGATP